MRKTIMILKAKSKDATNSDKTIMINELNRAINSIEELTNNRILIEIRQGSNLED